MIDVKILKNLVKLMVDNDLTEVDLADGEETIKLKRGSGQAIPTVVAAPAPVPGAAPAPAPAPAASAAPSAAAETAAPAAAAGETIDSPMVGSFYSASSPDAKAFASVGDSVTEDSVVCIVEAMKVFNEIKAEKKGTIKKVLVENGQAVEFGQPLFEIELA